ncbi:MAG: ribonuclease PH, partial [Anaerolineae bacterium]|nr:ribonuclease PH [Anaerolineae bacterium]
PLLDLDYGEDSRAEVDCNVVLTAAGEFVEVQCTAEGQPFDRASLDALLDLAEKGAGELLAIQREALANRSSSV